MQIINVTHINTEGYTGILKYTHKNMNECDEYFKNRPGLTCLDKIINDDGTVTAIEGCKIVKEPQPDILENAHFGDVFLRRDGEHVVFHHINTIENQAYLIKKTLDKDEIRTVGFVTVYLDGHFYNDGNESPYDVIKQLR